MYREMTLPEFVDWCNRVANDLPLAGRLAVNRAAYQVYERAVEFSSGPYTKADQRKMYNPRGPYSRVAPHPPADPAMINIYADKRHPTGERLVDSWQIEPLVEFGDGDLAASVGNLAEHAQYMFELRDSPVSATSYTLLHPAGGLVTRWDDPGRGTEKMMARPLPERVVQQLQPRFEQEYAESVWALLAS